MPALKKLYWKDLTEEEQDRLTNCPNIHRTGSVLGMKKLYWGKDALCIRCGNYTYNVSSEPDFYEKAIPMK